jgi:hypothetical protein
MAVRIRLPIPLDLNDDDGWRFSSLRKMRLETVVLVRHGTGASARSIGCTSQQRARAHLTQSRAFLSMAFSISAHSRNPCLVL